MTKRKFTLLLALFMIVQAVVSCGGDGGATDTSADSSDKSVDETTADPEPLGLDPTLKFPDYDFRVYTRTAEEFYQETESGNVVEDAIYKRLRAVEELLGCKVSVIYGIGGKDYDTSMLVPLQAGEDIYDLVLTHGRAAFECVAAGVVNDLNLVPNIDLDRSWWNQDVRENLTIKGKTYAMTGDITLNNLQRTQALYFSHPLLTDYKLEFPYQLVKDGEWTLDVFETYVKNFAKDLNNDGKYDLENDLIGFSESEWGGCIARMYTTGTRVVEVDKDGIPQLTIYNEKTVDLYERMFNMHDAEYAELDIGMKNTMSAFKDSRLAFYASGIYDFENSTDTEIDFGIIPFPKYDESLDRYYQLVDAGSSLAVIPVTVTDLARTGAITEALAYYGQKYLFPAYYENAILNRYARDEESIEMLEIIRQSVTYDLAYFNTSQFGGALSNVGYNLATDRSLTFTTFYESRKESVEQLIRKSMESYN